MGLWLRVLQRVQGVPQKQVRNHSGRSPLGGVSDRLSAAVLLEFRPNEVAAVFPQRVASGKNQRSQRGVPIEVRGVPVRVRDRNAGKSQCLSFDGIREEVQRIHFLHGGIINVLGSIGLYSAAEIDFIEISSDLARKLGIAIPLKILY